MKIEKPYARKRTKTIMVKADPDQVFALMCPVREYEWEPGWTTNLILSNSGLVEEDCIFTTPAGASLGSHAKSREAIWVTPIHDPTARRLMMIKVTPDECVTRLDIFVSAEQSGASVTTSYQHTALTELGRNVVDQHTEVRFDEMMAAWQKAIEETLEKKAA